MKNKIKKIENNKLIKNLIYILKLNKKFLFFLFNCDKGLVWNNNLFLFFLIEVEAKVKIMFLKNNANITKVLLNNFLYKSK